MFSLESPHRGDSNEYTQYTIFNIEKIALNYPISAAMGFFQAIQKQVRNSQVRATEVLLYTKVNGYIFGILGILLSYF